MLCANIRNCWFLRLFATPPRNQTCNLSFRFSLFSIEGDEYARMIVLVKLGFLVKFFISLVTWGTLNHIMFLTRSIPFTVWNIHSFCVFFFWQKALHLQHKMFISFFFYYFFRINVLLVRYVSSDPQLLMYGTRRYMKKCIDGSTTSQWKVMCGEKCN